MKRVTSMMILSVAIALNESAAAAAAESHNDDLRRMVSELQESRRSLEAQQRALDVERTRLQGLEDEVLAELRARGVSDAAPPAEPPETVAEASAPAPAPPEVAALGEQGGVITSRRRFTVESALEYARADRNRFVFRGIEIPQSVLIGVFDINESRQDVLTAAAIGRLGLTRRLELSVRAPYVYRSDVSVLTPVADAASGGGQTTQDFSARGGGFGDVELGMRYQLTDGRNGWPYLIAGLQVLAPTGVDPFEVDRDPLGNAMESATGAGFWGISPTLTALLPADPAVLFGTLGYTVNLSRNVRRMIGTTWLEEVSPGDEPSLSVGIGVALNPRTSISFGYAHTWSFGTQSVVRLLDSRQSPPVLLAEARSRTRDLQLGRYIFGVSYRMSPMASINWNLEVGATEDAADVRTTFRMPLTFAR